MFTNTVQVFSRSWAAVGVVDSTGGGEDCRSVGKEAKTLEGQEPSQLKRSSHRLQSANYPVDPCYLGV